MNKNIIVIGASAGGLSALKHLVSKLPAATNAAMFVVLHIPAWRSSDLPQILSANGPLPAAHAEHNEPIAPGRIYVAPPDRHMLLEDHRVCLWKGPKENLFRPAINPLFRSAAIAHGAGVVGVILSGQMDDGSAGLWLIKRSGGVAIVQDPNDAEWPEMPENALNYIKPDYVATAYKIGDLISELAKPNGTSESSLHGRIPQ